MSFCIKCFHPEDSFGILRLSHRTMWSMTETHKLPKTNLPFDFFYIFLAYRRLPFLPPFLAVFLALCVDVYLFMCFFVCLFDGLNGCFFIGLSFNLPMFYENLQRV